MQESSEKPAIFSIDESGVICIAKPREQMTRASQPVDAKDDGASVELHSALHDMGGEVDSLKKALEA